MDVVLELYGAPTGNCIRAAIALEEAGLAYSARHVDLAGGEHKRADHLALNPAGKVPMLVERKGDEPVFVLTQSNAIIFYAAERTRDRLLPEADRPRATTYERFFFFLTDVIAVSHAAFSLRNEGISNGSTSLLKRMLTTIEMAEHFVRQDAYMASDSFSMADIAAYTIIASVEAHLPWARLPNLRRWYEVVADRPSVVRGLRAFGPI